MPQPIKIPFPKKGVNRNYNREDQNGMQQGFGSQMLPETTWNANNVLPYDRWDRLRLGQRPGTVKQYVSALASAAVFLLGQTTIGLDPTTLVPTTQAALDAFTYANGNLDTVSPAGTWWGAVNSLLPGLSVTESAGAYVVTSNVAVPQPALTIATATYLPVIPLTVNYSVKGTINLQDTAASLNQGTGFMVRIDKTNYGNTAQVTYCAVNRHHAAILQGNSATPLASLTFSVQPTAGTHTIEFRITGTTAAIFLDGVSQVTASIGNNGQQGVGMYSTSSTQTIDNFEIDTLAAQATYRQTNLVAASGGSVFVGDNASLPLAGSGTGVLAASIRPSMAYSGGFAYIVDGASIVKVDLKNRAVNAYTATAGSAPSGCTVAAVWRDRLILAAPVTSPQNFYCSRVGVATDWDYSQTDPAAAFAGSASTAGHIGEPITALMPFNDDTLLIGGDHNLWRVNGDPADGGSIDLVSDQIGVLGPSAWTKDPTGTIYFLGTGGLYKIAPGGGPELLSGSTYNQFFTGINRTTNYLTLVWDRDRQGCYILVEPFSNAQGTSLWFDARNGGLWPIQYPAAHGPVSAILYDGDDPTTRFILLGGRDGFARRVAATALDDDGTAISCLVSLGPIQPAPPTGDAVVTAMDVDLGENFGSDASTIINANWTLKGGKSAYEVTEGTPRRIAGGTFTAPGRQQTRRQRLRGGWFALEFGNSTLDTYFSLERVVLHVEGQGKQR